MITTNTLLQNQIDQNALTSFVDQLYSSALKPKLTNLNHATQVITAYDNDILVGFLALYHNTSFPQYLIIGNFECINNVDAAQALFLDIRTKASELKCTTLIGPMNGSTWHSYRFSLYAQPPFFMELIHKDYYIDLWKKCGFEDMALYQTNFEDINESYNQPNAINALTERGLTTRNFDKNQVEKDLNLLYNFCMDVFSQNVLFSPISYDEFQGLYLPFLHYLDETLIDFVFDREELVGLFFAVKDHYNPKQVIVKTLARNPHPKYKGIANIMSAIFCTKAYQMGFKTMLHAYFHIDNNSAKVSTNYGGRHYQSHVLMHSQL